MQAWNELRHGGRENRPSRHRRVARASGRGCPPYNSSMTSTMLPVAGVASDLLQDLISGGQPVVLVDPSGRPVAVVLDVESYEEAEEAVAAA